MPVTITTRNAPPAQGVPSAIDSLFVPAKITAAGLPTTAAVGVRSISDYEAAGGKRTDNAKVYDGLDNYFREGGAQAYVGRYSTTTVADGLALFTEGLGGGQVVDWDSTPGATSDGALLDYAAATKRFAVLDSNLTDDTVAKLTTRAGQVPTQNNDYGVLVGPYVTIPAPSGVLGGSARQAPASSTVAALLARSDALGNPNRAPAGRDFPLQYATDLVNAPITDADAAALRAAGLNPLRRRLGILQLDGFQTSRDVDPNDPFWQANPARARMWLQWGAYAIGLEYEYKTIDGQGRLEHKLKTALDALCLQLYGADGLFGDSPADAFTNTVDASVNPLTAIAQGELHGVCEARFSLHARTVIIDLVSVPVTGRVSGAA